MAATIRCRTQHGAARRIPDSEWHSAEGHGHARVEGTRPAHGNNVTINLELDDLAETQRLLDALSEGGTDIEALTEMFWGAHWGTCCDRFGVRWMFNCPTA